MLSRPFQVSLSAPGTYSIYTNITLFQNVPNCANIFTVCIVLKVLCFDGNRDDFLLLLLFFCISVVVLFPLFLCVCSDILNLVHVLCLYCFFYNYGICILKLFKVKANGTTDEKSPFDKNLSLLPHA